MNENPLSDKPRPSGCLKVALAGPVLFLLAPVVALLRTVGRARRGKEVIVRRDETPFPGMAQGSKILLSMMVDVPPARDISRVVTDRVVRIAEGLAEGGESYHLLRREPGSEEAVVVSFGASVQAFAERFLISCRRTSHLDRRVVWVVLPRGEVLGASLDPLEVDPDAEGQPRILLEALPFRWSISIRRTAGLSSSRWEMLLAGPPEMRNFADRLEAAVTKIPD